MTDASRARREAALRRGAACPDWYHEDNVFPSQRRMDTEAMDRVFELMLALGYLKELPKDFTDLRFVEEAL